MRERLALAVFLLIIAVAPFPFGSSDLWAIACWNALLGGVLLLLPLGNLRRAQLVLLALVLVLCAALAFGIHEQISRHPVLASHLANPIWDDASKLLGLQLSPIVSIADGVPVLALGRPLAAMLSLVCAFILGQRSTTARYIFLTVALSGALYAVFGIISFAVDPTTVLGRQKETYRAVLTATFINRNTAAAYFGTCAVLWLLFVLQKIRRRFPGAMSVDTVKAVIARPTQALTIRVAALLIVVGAAFMTGSRAGTLLSFAACTLAIFCYFWRDWNSRAAGWFALVWILATSLVIWQLLGSGITERIEQQGLIDAARLQSYRSTVAMIADYPWLGTGFGTFEWAFPHYRSADLSTWGTWDKAHNTPLEIAAELGIPAALAVLSGWLVMLAILVRGVLVRSRGRIFASAGLAIALQSGLHSMVDFPLQVPGYAIVVFAILGGGLAQSLREQRTPAGSP